MITEFRVTDIVQYIRCGEQFRRYKIEGEKIPPGIAAVGGISFHKAAAHNFSQKIESKRDLPAAEIIDVAIETLRAQIKHEGLWLSPSDQLRGKAILVNETERSLRGFGNLFHDRVAPKYQPLFVEAERKLSLLGDGAVGTLLGHPDLETVRKELVDHKTHKRNAPSADEADRSLQLDLYSLLFQAAHAEMPKAVVLEHLVNGSGGMSSITQQSPRQREHLVAAVETVKTVVAAVNAGSFPPAPRIQGAWWCSAKFCGYHATCKYIPAHKRGVVIALFIALVAGISFPVMMSQIQEFKSVEKTVELQRAYNPSEIERAALSQEIVAANRWLASMQWWNDTIVEGAIPDEVDSLKPIQ